MTIEDFYNKVDLRHREIIDNGLYEVDLMHCDEHILAWLKDTFTFGSYHYFAFDDTDERYSHFCYFDNEEDAVLCRLTWG